MTRGEAETLARERLTFLAGRRDEMGNADWSALATACEWALHGDARGIDVFRRVFDEREFAMSASCMEVGYAALGLGLLGDRASLARLERPRSLVNGNGEALQAARVLLGIPA